MISTASSCAPSASVVASPAASSLTRTPEPEPGSKDADESAESLVSEADRLFALGHLSQAELLYSRAIGMLTTNLVLSP